MKSSQTDTMLGHLHVASSNVTLRTYRTSSDI